MAYIGAPPLNRVLSSADIAQGAVTLDDINFTDQPVNMDITGTIDKHTMRLADGVTITGDVTISDDLVLSKISDDGNAITMTNDGSSRTITGSGSIEASTLSQTPNQSLTGMTGTVGSAVTNNAGVASGVIESAVTGTLGSGVTFPAGMIIKSTFHTSAADVSAMDGSPATAVETDDNDVTVSCTATNKLNIWINGGYVFTNATGIYMIGMRIIESGQSDVDLYLSHSYSRGTNEYKNDGQPSIFYQHTAVSSSVTIKRLTYKASGQCYWEGGAGTLGNTPSTGANVRYFIQEEKG